MSVQQGTRSDYTAVQFQRSNPNGGAEAEAMEDQRTNCQEHATAHERRWSWQTEGEATLDIAHRKGDNCTSGRVANLGGNFVGCQKHETSLKDVFLATSFSPPLYHQTLPFPRSPHSLHFARSNVSFGGIDYSRVFESTRALRRMVQTLNDDLSLNGKTAKTDSSPESGQLLNSRRKLKHWDIEQRFLSWKICRRCRESPFFHVPSRNEKVDILRGAYIIEDWLHPSISLSLPLLQLLSTKIQVTVAEPLVIEFPDVASWFIVIAFLPEFWLLPNLYWCACQELCCLEDIFCN